MQFLCKCIHKYTYVSSPSNQPYNQLILLKETMWTQMILNAPVLKLTQFTCRDTLFKKITVTCLKNVKVFECHLAGLQNTPANHKWLFFSPEGKSASDLCSGSHPNPSEEGKSSFPKGKCTFLLISTEAKHGIVTPLKCCIVLSD